MKKNLTAEEVTFLLTKQQLAARLSLTVRGIECLVASRKIPALKISRRCLRFDWARVSAALNKFELKEVA